LAIDLLMIRANLEYSLCAHYKIGHSVIAQLGRRKHVAKLAKLTNLVNLIGGKSQPHEKNAQSFASNHIM
jgi:hypothetical protein